MFDAVLAESLTKFPIPPKEKILDIQVEHESDIMLSRRLTRQLSMLLSLGTYRHSSISAAVSEAVRVVFQSSPPCRVSWFLDRAVEPPAFCVEIFNEKVFPFHRGVRTASPVLIRDDPGLALASRLVDDLKCDVSDSSVRVTLRKRLEQDFPPEAVERLREKFKNRKPENFIEELQLQNQSMIRVIDDLRRRYQELLRLHLSLEESNAVLLEANRDLQETSLRDPLTGLLNRLCFEETFHTRSRCAREIGEPFSLIFFDVDDFKEINDLCGHSAGDRALVAIADLVSVRLRKDDSFFRWGGEEFLIIPFNCDLDGAVSLAWELQESIERQCLEEMDLTCSFGVTSYTPGDDSRKIVDRADRAMYTAKRKGKNRVEVVI